VQPVAGVALDGGEGGALAIGGGGGQDRRRRAAVDLLQPPQVDAVEGGDLLGEGAHVGVAQSEVPGDDVERVARTGGGC
jgi:hypothetical protein